MRATPAAAPAERPLTDTDDLPEVDKLSRAFAAVASKLEPAVVNIFTEGTERAQRPPAGTPLDDFFERFFATNQKDRDAAVSALVSSSIREATSSPTTT